MTEATKTDSKTVANDMDNRRVFATPEAATEYLMASAQNYSDFSTLPFAAPGVDSEGAFDPAIYNDSTEVMVSVLKNAGKTVNGVKKPGSTKAIVVVPAPTLDALLAREDGRLWIQKIIHKELNHVAVRALREAEDVSTVIDQIPTTIEGFITSTREGGSGILEAFNDLYKQVNSTLSTKIPVWNKARLVKSEFKKCLESKGYALEYYSALEDRGEGKDSLFVLALQLFTVAAKKKGLDTTIFDRWAATRDAKVYTADESDEDDFDLDSLTESLLEAPAEEEAAASE